MARPGNMVYKWREEANGSSYNRRRIYGKLNADFFHSNSSLPQSLVEAAVKTEFVPTVLFPLPRKIQSFFTRF